MSDEKTNIPQEAETAQEAALPFKLDIAARLIEPKGNLLGFASVKFNDSFVVEDFKILKNEKDGGIFVGMPSKPDRNSKTGYRDTAKPITKEFRAELTAAVEAAYYEAVEKVHTRAAAITGPESIKKGLAEGAEQAAKDNAARQTASVRPAPAKGKAQNAER